MHCFSKYMQNLAIYVWNGIETSAARASTSFSACLFPGRTFSWQHQKEQWINWSCLLIDRQCKNSIYPSHLTANVKFLITMNLFISAQSITGLLLPIKSRLQNFLRLHTSSTLIKVYEWVATKRINWLMQMRKHRKEPVKYRTARKPASVSVTQHEGTAKWAHAEVHTCMTKAVSHEIFPRLRKNNCLNSHSITASSPPRKHRGTTLSRQILAESSFTSICRQSQERSKESVRHGLVPQSEGEQQEILWVALPVCFCQVVKSFFTTDCSSFVLMRNRRGKARAESYGKGFTTRRAGCFPCSCNSQRV